jgi:hypothetical protein
MLQVYQFWQPPNSNQSLPLMPLPSLTSENSFSQGDRFSGAGIDPLGEIEPYLILHHL